MAFRQRARQALADPQLQRSLAHVQDRFVAARLAAWGTVPAIEALRERAARVRAHTLEGWDRYLARLAEAVEARGGEVHFAPTAADARRIVLELCRRHGARRVVKSKSMVTEEIGLNEALEGAGIQVLETDLGEFIVQLAGERPFHIIAPAVHKTAAEVAELFSRLAGEPVPPEREALVAFARRYLREAFLTAQVGISGVNFAVAETGTLVLVTNEGNGRLVTTLPPVHIAVMGAERIVPTLEDLALMLELLPRSATGQAITSYVTLQAGPRGPGEVDGPEHLHLVIVDNGRSAFLGTPFQEALRCIRCGACLNVCPVYQSVGGHAYGGTYAGPIGSVIQPLLDGEEATELPWASSLCHACRDACPVKIDLPELLVAWREALPKKGYERQGYRLLAFGMGHPRLYRWLRPLLRRLLRFAGRRGWGPSWMAG